MLIRLHRTVYLQLLIPVLLLLIPVQGNAQSELTTPHLGITLDSGSDSLPDSDMLERLQGMGIDYLEMSPPLDRTLLGTALENGFHLMLQQSRAFTTTTELQASDSLFLARDVELLRDHRSELSGATGLSFSPFLWPYDRTDEARRQLSDYANQLRSVLSTPEIEIYYSALASNPEDSLSGWDAVARSLDVRNQPPSLNSGILRLAPENGDSETLRTLYKWLESESGVSGQRILIPWSWLNRMMQHHPWIEEVLTIHHEENSIISPYPAETGNVSVIQPELGWIFMMGLLYLLLIRYSSFVQESGWRYFTSHTYYKEQILPFRLRSAGPGLLFQVQLLIMWILLWTLFYQTLPIQGQLLLQEWVLPIEPNRGTFWIPFQWGTLFATLHSLFLIWVWTFNTRYNWKEVLALFGWPLQLLIIPTLLITLLYWNELSAQWIGTGFAIWILLWISINYLTALDILRSLDQRRILFGIAITLHLCLTLILFLALFFYPPLQEPLHMLWVLLESS